MIIIDYVGQPIDVNYLEAMSLHNKLMDCMVDNGFVKDEVFNDNFDVYDSCGISNKVVMDDMGGFFYFNVTFLDLAGKEVRGEISKGNTGYYSDCDVKRNSASTTRLVECYYRNESYLYLDKSGDVKKIKLVVLSASDNAGERVVKGN
jgi:hypothetical protein